MLLNENIRQEIVNRITQKLRVKDIILFGSYAHGQPNENSDIDLVVILDENGFVGTFKERIQRRQQVSRLFFDMRKKTSMDFLVYSTDEWQRAIRLNSSFIREIIETGKSIL